MASVLKTMFETGLGVSVLIAVLLLLRPLLAKRYRAKWQYWACLVLAMRLFLPFALPQTPAVLTVPMANFDVYTIPDKSSVPALPSDILPVSEAADTYTQAPQAVLATAPPLAPITALRTVSAGELAGYVWISVAIILLCVRFTAYFIAKHRVKKSAVPISFAILAPLMSEMHIRRKIPIQQSSLCENPMLLGLIAPCIMLPKALQSTSQTDIILRHELCHYKRKDIAYQLLLVAVSCMYWYNPLVWLMARCAREDIELSCDESVTRGKDDAFKAAYGDALINTLLYKRSHRILLSSCFAGKASMKARLDGIFSKASKKHGLALLAVLLCASLVSGAFVACSPMMPVAINDEPLAPLQAASEGVPSLTDAMLLPINLYEHYGMGKTRVFEGQTQLITCFGYGYADKNPPTEDSDPTLYNLTPAALEQFSSLFCLSSGETEPDNQGFRYVETVLSLIGSQRLTNGDLRLTFKREYDAVRLKNVVYTLREGKAENVPELAATLFAEGDTVYRLVSVENIDLEPPVKTREIKISTAEDLVEMSRSINLEGWKYSDCTFVQTADIDLKGLAFEPIGLTIPLLKSNYDFDERDSTLAGFNSTYDGNGHTITNLSVRFDAELFEKGSYSCGLFGIIGDNGIVKNLNITNADIYAIGKNLWYHQSAGILAGTSSGYIENCHVSGKVEGVTQVGGLVGYANSTASVKEPVETTARAGIIDCSADVDVIGNVYAGGLVGTSFFVDVSGCEAKGSVTAYSSGSKGFSMGSPAGIGGFIGSATFTDVNKCDADTRLIIKDNGVWIGSVIGWASNSTVRDSSYAKASTGNWRPISVIDEKAAPESHPSYKLTAK